VEYKPKEYKDIVWSEVLNSLGCIGRDEEANHGFRLAA
jgi:hypothetical protein